MSVYKDKEKGTWRVIYRYIDFQGKRRQTQKRGFKTKREALEWERKMMLKNDSKLNMNFETFFELYKEYKKERVKLNTWETKNSLITRKILPYFGKRKINEITANDVIAWQNELMAYRKEDGMPYKATYLQTIHSQLSAIFNHAVRFYDLPRNPAEQAGNFVVDEFEEMQFWTKDEYMKFIAEVMDKPMSFYAFEVLYWCGLRLGEMLALTPLDFDFERKILKVTKSYQRIKKQDYITTPKTKKSIRNVKMPDFICDEIQDYLKMLYKVKNDERIFTRSKSYFHREMDRGCNLSGVNRIRIHDLRHSHVSLLINAGLTPLDIAERVGHEAIEITYHYAHLFPTRQDAIVDMLDMERREAADITFLDELKGEDNGENKG